MAQIFDLKQKVLKKFLNNKNLININEVIREIKLEAYCGHEFKIY